LPRLQERLSTFWGTVPTGHTAELNFTGTPARVFRIWLPYADPDAEVVFVINYFQVGGQACCSAGGTAAAPDR
jgi:hypothetical protein